MVDDRKLGGKGVSGESLDSVSGGIIYYDEGDYVVVNDKNGDVIEGCGTDKKRAEEVAKRTGQTIEIAPTWQYKHRFPDGMWL